MAALLPAFGAVEASWIVQVAADHAVHLDGPLTLGMLALLPLGAVAIGGTAASIIQERLVFVAPSFKAERLNPKEGLKRMFSGEAAIAAARALLAVAIAAVALVPTANEVFARGVGSSDIPFLAPLARSAAGRVMLSVMAVGALFSIVDVILVRARWRKSCA